jgi:hypothetical protein
MTSPDGAEEPADDPAARARRRRRLDALGDVSLERSGDDTDEGWSDGDVPDADPDREDELRREVPPHHG